MNKNLKRKDSFNYINVSTIIRNTLKTYCDLVLCSPIKASIIIEEPTLTKIGGLEIFD